MNRIHFSEQIHATPRTVWETMLGDATYRDWTSVFAEGSYFEGSWEEGQEIRFLSPQGGGMLAVIAAHRPYELLAIRHIGMVKADGEVDTESEEVKKWTPAMEIYHFVAIDGGTEVRVEMDAAADFEQFMRDAWPKALSRVKELSEAP